MIAWAGRPASAVTKVVHRWIPRFRQDSCGLFEFGSRGRTRFVATLSVDVRDSSMIWAGDSVRQFVARMTHPQVAQGPGVYSCPTSNYALSSPRLGSRRVVFEPRDVCVEVRDLLRHRHSGPAMLDELRPGPKQPSMLRRNYLRCVRSLLCADASV